MSAEDWKEAGCICLIVMVIVAVAILIALREKRIDGQSECRILELFGQGEYKFVEWQGCYAKLDGGIWVNVNEWEPIDD